MTIMSLFRVSLVDVGFDVLEGREICWFEKFVGHISFVGFLNDILFTVWCGMCDGLEVRIYGMVPRYLWIVPINMFR